MKRVRLKRALPETKVPAVGYVRGGGDDSAHAEAEAQRVAIEGACDRLGLGLVAVARDGEPNGSRPGLARALESLDAGEATCLVVSELTLLSSDVSELATLVDRLERGGVRLIALDVGLDTATPSGQLVIARRAPRDLPWAPPPEETVEEKPAPVEEPVPIEEPAAAAEPAVVVEEAAAEEAAPVADEPAPAVEDAPPAAPPEPAPAPRVAVRALGYASVPTAADPDELEAQRRAIERGCEREGFELVELVGDREPKDGKALDRPGLSHAMQRIAAGDASCLVVGGLERLSRSVAELGTLVQWLERNNVRLVAMDLGLDTATQGGRVAARALASVGDWERQRLSERTRTGLAAARAKRHAVGGPAQPDWVELRKRIAAMRADGMTLQAIADVLNEEGVPTQRGGAMWRPSSVQNAAGYKRRSRSKSISDLPAVKTSPRPARDPRPPKSS